jgi:hypothetical protein
MFQLNTLILLILFGPITAQFWRERIIIGQNAQATVGSEQQSFEVE